MTFNMAIRTLSINSNICKYPVGGGIVWDSTPEDEWEEAQLKSKILEEFIR
jgi:para-aminobenzoate synthetase/4-amino-4-deoxychorismate lyase